MSEIWGIPSPTNRGPKTAFFGRLRNITANLTAYISSEQNTIYITGQVRWQLHEISYIVSKCYELRSTNDFKLYRHFYPPYVNCAFYFIAMLRRRTSANGTQPNVAKRWMVNRANGRAVKVKLPEKIGAKKLLHLFRFSTTSAIDGEYLLNETWYRQSGNGVGKYEGSSTLPQNFMKYGPQTV